MAPLSAKKVPSVVGQDPQHPYPLDPHRAMSSSGDVVSPAFPNPAHHHHHPFPDDLLDSSARIDAYWAYSAKLHPSNLDRGGWHLLESSEIYLESPSGRVSRNDLMLRLQPPF
eukprot:CAMPEP_0197240264 /NCGR_PEP_ID=MMETSP1429-20130617/6584_1 /TAXON_ID=49237 /ORGANISM="Chaetoceros  sp., Strain UNC1202" /LENGTH=112 /DNA_ID=CAMNT_0042699865 /DNA_START=239 /DNA_END=574 /DNA_ORIENTATION=+